MSGLVFIDLIYNSLNLSVLMGVTTFEKYLHFILICVVFFLGLADSHAQCPTVTNSTQTFCDTQSPNVGSLVATNNGGGVRWYPAANTPAASFLSLTAPLVDGEDYFVDDNTGSCGTRQRVVVTIYGAPAAQGFQGPCVDDPSEATISDLTATGNNIQWYTAAFGGSALAPATVLVNNAIYYASQTNPITGCETSRRPVRVRVGVVPTPTGAAVQQFCDNPADVPTIEDLVISGGANHNWYSSPFSPLVLPLNTPLVNGASYYATTVDLPCESAIRFEVQAVLVPTNDAGTNGVFPICENEVATTAPINLFGILGGTPDANGTWSGPLPTLNGAQGTVDVSSLTLAGSPYVFTYTVTSALCPPSTATVTLPILILPEVSIGTDATICSGDSATVTFTGTPNAKVIYTVNNGPNQDIQLNAAGQAFITQSYTETTIYTLISIASAGTPSCSQLQDGRAIITILPLPTVSMTEDATICFGESATINFVGTPAATVTYTINSGSNQTIVLSDAGTASLSGTFNTTTTYTLVSVASTGTPICTQMLADSVVITVVPLPIAAIAMDINICPGDEATVNFTGTANTTVTYTVNSGPSQTILLNAAGLASITQTYSTTTVYTLVSVATLGTPNCIRPLDDAVTITVLPLPEVTISADTTICSGDAATVTFIGTANATVTYTINSGPSQTIVLDGTGQAFVSGNYTTTTIFDLVSITSSGNPACTKPVLGRVTITVLPLPTVAIAENQTICPNESATVTFIGTLNATVTYTVNNGPNQTIILNASGNAEITQTYTSTTVYTLVSVATNGTPGCIRLLTNRVTIDVLPLPFAKITQSTTICAGDVATVNFNGTAGASVVYTINSGPNQTIILDENGLAAITQMYVATTVYSLVSVTSPIAPFCMVPAQGVVTITVLPLPTVDISEDITICSGENATVNFVGTPNAVITYTVNNGPNLTITLDGTGNASINQSFSTTTVFTLVRASTSGSPGCSQIQNGQVTVTVVPLPTVAITADVTICSGGSATVNFSGTANATVAYTVNNGPQQTIVLNGTGNASITGNYTETTVFDLISVTVFGTPNCSKEVNGRVTITVLPLPTATISSDVNICINSSATVTFNGTPNAIVTYTVNNGSEQTITLNGLGIATITSTYTITTVYRLLNVTLPGTPPCSQTLDSFITITVVPLPSVVIAEDVTICPGNSATITFTGTANATVNYTVNNGPQQSIVLNAAGIAEITQTYTATTVYDLVSMTASGCTQPQIGRATVTIVPPPTVTIGTDVSVCPGGSATITFTGTPNAIATYTINNGPQLTIPLNGSGQATITGNYTETTTFTLISVASAEVSGCSQLQEGQATITVVPLPTVLISAESTTVCAQTTGTVIFTGTPNAIVTYTVNNGPEQTITLSNLGTASISNTLAIETTYRLVRISTSGTPACSQTQIGEVKITTVAPPVAGNDVANLSLCSNGVPVDLFSLLGANAQIGGTWLPTLASGTGIFNPAVDAAGIYVYTVTGNEPCPNDTASVTITIIPPPNAGNDNIATICSNDNPQDLFLLLGPLAQAGGTWSPALASGTGFFNPDIDTAGNYTYTVNPATSTCGSDSAVVTVNIIQGPDAGDDGALSLCVNSLPQNLFNYLNGTPQVGGTWSPTLASGNGIFNPAVDSAGVYTYTFVGNQPCDNDTATVTVMVNPIPNAGGDGAVTFCTNFAPSDLFLNLAGSPQSGGTWSPALASGTGVFNPAVDPAGVYTYSVGGNLCTTATATVTVTVLQAPNAGGPGATLNVCITSTSVNLTTGLNGTQEIGTWADDDATGALTGNIFNPSAVAAGTYHFTYTVGGGGNSQCQFDTATVTVVVNPLANAGTFSGIQSICSSAGTFDLFALLTGNQAGGIWTDNNGATVTNPVNVSAFSAGNYSFTYTVTNICNTDNEIVQFAIIPAPTVTIPNISIATPICSGDEAIVSFTGMADGSYILNYNLLGSNVAANQSVALIISGGIGSFQIPSPSIVNPGTTAVNFIGITNTTTTCSTVLSNISVNFVIRPVSNLENSNISIANVCLGINVQVLISGATGLSDGNYQFNFSLPNGTPANGSTATVPIANGSGSFTIPSSFFPTAGNYTITINSINSISGGCTNINENASASFQILPLINISPATVTAGEVCLGNSGQVFVTNATDLSNGTYTIQYQLSGANSASGIATIIFTNGNGSFVIPATNLTNSGAVTVAFQLASVSSSCGVSGSFNQVTFNVVQLGLPEIIPQGNEFCEDEAATIANLSSNIAGSQTVNWYLAPSGGEALNPSTLLNNNIVYYAALTSAAGCEGTERLPVTVSLINCNEIIIPDGFSPNGDNINDTFEIVDIRDIYPNFKIEIYNRYGNILFKGHANVPDWDGTSSEGGVKLGDGVAPVGVYFYILEFNDGTRKPQQGRLYLSR